MVVYPQTMEGSSAEKTSGNSLVKRSFLSTPLPKTFKDNTLPGMGKKGTDVLRSLYTSPKQLLGSYYYHFDAPGSFHKLLVNSGVKPARATELIAALDEKYMNP